ncbi:hypothetical protein ACJX0J_021182, partial [Zea mays]
LRISLRNANLEAKDNIRQAAEEEEVERSASTLATFDESTSVLQKSEGEYQGHRSLLMRTRGLLSTMQQQDVFD